MRKTIKTISILLLVFLSFTLFSCDFDESQHHLSGGVLLDDEKISEIKNEVLSGIIEKDTEENSTEANTSSEKENNDEKDGIVYWTESGSVWHESAGCSHLKNSTKIVSGSVADAQKAGKSKACTRCSD